MLDEHSGETLHRSEWCTVYHHRCLLGVVLSCVFEFETLRQVVIHLNGTQLPTAANRIFHHKVELRTIEGCFAIFHLCLQAFLLTSIDDGLLALCPNLIRTDILLLVVRITKGNLRLHILEVEDREHRLDDVHNAEELTFHLIRTTEDMGIILRERTYTSQSVQLTTLLVAINGTELSNTQRQVFI